MEGTGKNYFGKMILNNQIQTALIILILFTFLPLLLGMNFLPLERYPEFAKGVTEAADESVNWDGSYKKAYQDNPFIFDIEPGWFTINLPQDYYFARSLRNGKIPLWDPYTGCGFPTFDSGQFRPFNPLKIIFYLYPSLYTYSLYLFLQLLMGLIAFKLWLQSKGISAESAFAGAFLFAFNPWILLRLPQTDGSGYLIFPFVMLALERTNMAILKSLFVDVLAFVWLCNASHPEVFLLLSGIALLNFILKSNERKKAVVFTVKIIFLTSIAVLPLWLPSLLFFIDNESYKGLAVLFKYPYSIRGLFTLSSDLYLLPVVAAITAMGFMQLKKNAFWILLFAISLVFLIELPFVRHGIGLFLQKHFFFQIFYLKLPFWIAFSYLFANSADKFLKGDLLKLDKVVLIMVSVTFLLISFFVFRFYPLPEAISCRHSSTLFVLSIISFLSIVFFIVHKNTNIGRISLIFALAPLAFPLSGNSLTWNRTDYDIKTVFEKFGTISKSERVASLFFHPAPVLPPNWGQVFGIRQIEANAVVFPNRLLQLFHFKKFPFTMIVFDYPERMAFEQMGCSIVAHFNRGENLEAFPRFKKIFTGERVSFYRIEGAKGRLFLAEKAVPFDPAKDISKEVVDLGRGNDGYVVVEKMDAGFKFNVGSISAAGSAEFLKDEEEKIEIKVRAEKRALLVLRDNYSRNWKATIDGIDALIVRVNGCFRGVFIEKGDHVVRFAYKPIVLIVTLWASFLILAFLLFIIIA